MLKKSLSLGNSVNSLDLFEEPQSQVCDSIATFERNNFVQLSSKTKEAIIEMAYNGGLAY